MNESVHRATLAPILAQLNTLVLGNTQANKLALVCLLAEGHLLIEDIPGVGKTTLSKALALSLGLDFRRVQFTSDLLPSDVIGVNIFDVERTQFQFKKGPIFTPFLLADEVNRASPKTQSALLQAMEERRVSVDGQDYTLNDPFFVVATQNPIEQFGTFPLPESQLDRFLMRLSLGYPGEAHEKQLLSGQHSLADVTPIMDVSELKEHINAARDTYASAAAIDYLWAILDQTRQRDYFHTGLSPRAGMQWLRAAKALAYLEGRDAVLPDDIKHLATAVGAHRLVSRSEPANPEHSQSLLTSLIRQIPVR